MRLVAEPPSGVLVSLWVCPLLCADGFYCLLEFSYEKSFVLPVLWVGNSCEAHTESGTIAQWHSPAVVVYLVLMTPNWAAVIGELRLGKCWGTVKKNLHPILIVMCLWWLRFLHCSQILRWSMKMTCLRFVDALNSVQSSSFLTQLCLFWVILWHM